MEDKLKIAMAHFNEREVESVSLILELEEEIKKRKKYEGFLKSVIKCGNDLDDNHTFEWFCEQWGDILKD